MDANMVPAYEDALAHEKSRFYPMAILNVLLFAGQITVNALAATGVLFGKSVGDVSRGNETRITPASYAFSIWSLIYLLQAVFVLRFLTKSPRDIIVEGLFAFSTLLNAAWIVSWSKEELEVSMGILIGLWFTLTTIWFILQRRERNLAFKPWFKCLSWRHLFDFFSLHLGFSIYFGWVSAATLANVAVVLNQPLTDEIVIAIICSLGAFALILSSYTGDIGYPAAVLWALSAIIKRAHDNDDNLTKHTASLAFTALSGAVIARFFCTISFSRIFNAEMQYNVPDANAPEFLALSGRDR